MDNAIFKTVTLDCKQSKEGNGKYDYSIDDLYVGSDEEGFNLCLELIYKKSDINSLVVRFPLSGSKNSGSFKESLPFFSYPIGYEALIELCSKKGVSLKYQFD